MRVRVRIRGYACGCMRARDAYRFQLRVHVVRVLLDQFFTVDVQRLAENRHDVAQRRQHVLMGNRKKEEEKEEVRKRINSYSHSNSRSHSF